MPNTAPYLLAMAIIALAVAWTPLFLKWLPVSWPILAVGIGFALFHFFLPHREIIDYQKAAQALTEVALVVAIMGGGLKIDRPFSVRGWGSTWRLLGLVMPITIGLVAVAAHFLIDLPAGGAILLAAILSPTDPVLAADVQVGPPGTGEEGEVKFALTSEAGLNDGLAFPFVSLGLLMIERGTGSERWLPEWLLVDGLGKSLGALAIGFALGWTIVKVNGALPKHLRLSKAGDGLVFVAITFLAYGTAQMAGAYGFLAVFACAVTIRNVSPQVDLHRRLTYVGDQIERFSTAAVLAFFGGLLATGGLLRLTWDIVAVAAVALFVARPIGVAVSFLWSPATARERAAFAFFGIRGLASLFYAAYLLSHGKAYWNTVWPAVLVTVLASTIVFGMTSGFVMRGLGLESQRRPP